MITLRMYFLGLLLVNSCLPRCSNENNRQFYDGTPRGGDKEHRHPSIPKEPYEKIPGFKASALLTIEKDQIKKSALAALYNGDKKVFIVDKKGQSDRPINF